MSLKNEAFRKIARRMGTGPLALRFHPGSSLLQSGWFRSFRECRAIDRRGEAIPWWTYSAVHFIEPRLTPGLRVFEYGCGSSTVWLSRRVKEVISVEHDQRWAERVSSQLKSGSSQVILRELSGGYVEEIARHGYFDVVIIDGRQRVKCLHQCLEFLTPAGIIIWDNSEREDFAEGMLQAKRNGFRELPFWGLLPAKIQFSQTSILYREENCFGI